MFVFFLAFAMAASTSCLSAQVVAQEEPAPVAEAESGNNEFADFEEKGARLQERAARLNVDLDEVRRLTVQLPQVPEPDREAVMVRRDERAFRVLRDIAELAGDVAELPQGHPLREKMKERLQTDLSSTGEALFTHTRELDERIASFSDRANTLGGAERLAVEAYVYMLKQLRINALGAAADLLESRRVLQLPGDELEAALRENLYLRAETLVGRLQFSQSALDELKLQLEEHPKEADLLSAARKLNAMHVEDLERLKVVSELMARVGMDNALYKAELLQQGQEISVRDFEPDVLRALVQEEWVLFRDSAREHAPDLLFNLALILLVLFVTRILARLVRRLVTHLCERSSGDMSTLLKDVLASVSGGTVTLIGIFVALSMAGFALGPMLAGLGVAGFIVGFALQDTLGNFAAGSMILLYRPYDVDDFVEVAGASGLVKKMSLVSTTITTFDNQTLVVPNSKIWGDVIKNVTAQDIRRVDLEFRISYADDIEKAEQLLRDVVNEHPSTLEEPAPLIKVHSLGESSVNVIVRPWVKTAEYWAAYWDITREVKLRFDREGLHVPYPRRDYHVWDGGDSTS
ncbi:MAG: mechanosensitive ion channel family protein [Halioglobus sp.]